jgi:hypothetical protein
MKRISLLLMIFFILLSGSVFAKTSWQQTTQNSKCTVSINLDSLIYRIDGTCAFNTKTIFTEEGKADFLNQLDPNEQDKYKDLNYIIKADAFDGQNFSYRTISSTFYDANEKKFYEIDTPTDWTHVEHNSIQDNAVIAILQYLDAGNYERVMRRSRSR